MRKKLRIFVAFSIFLTGQLSLPSYAEQAFTPPSAIDVAGSGTSTNTSTPTVPESVMSGLNSASTLSGMNIIDFGSLAGGHLDFGNNNFANAAGGTIYAISSNSAIQTAQISALNIFNAGTITTIIPTGGLPGYSTASLVQGLNLSLSAVQNIVNTGSISSAGSLAVSAPAVYNALPAATAASVAPVMSAVQSLNIQTNNLINSGSLVSQLANLNVLTHATGNLAINSMGGTMQALNGTINIGQTTATQSVLQNLEINGGRFLSQQLNIVSANGAVNILTQSLSGALNISAGEAHVRSSGDLRIGNVTVTNDPSFDVDDNGNIILTGDIIATDENTGNVILSTGASILNQGASRIIAPGAGHVDMRAGGNIILDGLGLLASEGGQISLKAGNGLSWAGASGTILSGGGGVFMETGSILQIDGLQTVDTAGGDFGLQSSNGSITWASEGAVLTTNAGQVSVLAKQNIVATNLTINEGQTPAGQVGFIAKEGSLDLTGTSINSTYAPTTFAGGIVEFPLSSVLLGAPGDVTVGNITAPAGSVFVAAGAAILEDVPGFPEGTVLVQHQRNAGNVVVGNINIDSATKGGNGTIMVTTGVGDIQTGDISGNGSRLWVLTNSGNIKVGSIQDASRLPDSVPGKSDTAAHVDVRLVTLFGNLDVLGPIDVSGGNARFEAFTFGGTTINTPVIAREKFGNPMDLQIKGDSFVTVAGPIDAISENSARGVNRVLVAALSVVTGDINASGSGNADGGVIRVAANTIDTGVLNLTSNGAGSGAGGNIQVLTGADLNVTDSGIIRASAKGGEGGGNGGGVYFASGGHLTVNKSIFDVAPAGNAGKGGAIYLEGHTVEIQDNSLNADGKGTGDGGDIFITVRSGEQQLSFSNGSDMPKLFARSGAEGGNGGKIVIQGGGDVRVDSTHVNVDSRGDGGGDGGYISITAGDTSQTAFFVEDTQSGGLTINGNLNASGKGATGYGGTRPTEAPIRKVAEVLLGRLLWRLVQKPKRMVRFKLTAV